MTRELEPASEQYNDYRGTVALDDPHRDEKLYEMLGIDHTEWSILAMELWGGRVGEAELTSGVRVYVVPAKSESADEIMQRGEVTVREIECDGNDLALALLRDCFKRWHVTFTRGYIAEQGIRVVIDDD
jgi:hypothetical protein